MTPEFTGRTQSGMNGMEYQAPAPLKRIDAFTDGACSGNPGPGGWAVILRYGTYEREISGNIQATTNNRMEIFAAISALGAIKFRCNVHIHSDSAYLVNAFAKGWIYHWQSNGWKTAEGKPVENQDLWKLLMLAMRKHEVTYHKVEGHSDHPENNRCDALAKAEIKKFFELNPDYVENKKMSLEDVKHGE